MKVEASGHPIDVEDLAGKVHARHHAALHRLEVHILQRDASTGDEFFLEGGFALDRVHVVEQRVQKLVACLFAHVKPYTFRGDARLGHQVGPKLFGKVKWTCVEHLLLPGLDHGGVQDGRCLRSIGHPHPVHLKLKVVRPFCKFTRPPSGELQDRGATHAPMRQEQGTFLHKLGPLDPDNGFGDDDPHQRGDRLLGHVEREQRRHWGFNAVSEVGEPLQALRLGAAARGDHDTVEGLAVKIEASIDTPQFVDGRLKANVDPESLGLPCEAIDDGLGRICDREHPPVGLGLQLDPTMLKPRHRVLRLEFGEGLFQLFPAPWVVLGQLRRGKAGVGHVAPSSARDFDLGKKLGSPFK